MKKLFKMTESEVQHLANNPNMFGSMLARHEMNKRVIINNRNVGIYNEEVPYVFDANDREQYSRELNTVVWED